MTDEQSFAQSFPLLEARALHFAYHRGGREVVSSASLKLERGKMCALIGANGSGKSSLVRLLAGLLVPSRGEILLEGKKISSVSGRERAKRIGYVPQTISTVFPFTALEVVLTGRSPHTRGRFGFENRIDLRIARDALSSVDAAHLETRPVTELSGGERQLVMLARALAQEADLLLLDEPSSALDLKHRAGLVRHLRRACEERNLAALVVTHDLLLLDPAFDVVFAMRDGEIIASGSPSQVLNDRTLANVYAGARIRVHHADGRTFVWSEM